MKNFDLVESQASTDKVQRNDNQLDGASLIIEGYKGRVYEKAPSDHMYPSLPKLELEGTKFAADSRLPILNSSKLDDKDSRTAIRAEQAVQDRMTPEERRQLHKDRIDYEKAVESHKRADMIGALPFGYNKMPEKPASLQRYENAVSQEIAKRDPSFHSRNFMIDGTFHKPKETVRIERTPRDRQDWLREVILY